MNIGIVTPAPPGSLKGNRITALRWARLLRELGHRVSVCQRFISQDFECLIALHAQRSAGSIVRFRRQHPSRPLVVALTGTDIYGDIHRDQRARRCLELADRLVVLQPLAIRKLPARFRGKARVIYQSVRLADRQTRRRPAAKKPGAPFGVCVLAHLRSVKDPFRTALAARRLPESSQILVRHYGAPLTKAMARRARREMTVNARYRWYGEVPRHAALHSLGRSHLLVLTSRLEGGANVISEAIALGVPVLSSHIDGSVGLLGRDYPGYFPVGDAQALAHLLRRTETDARFYALLRRRCRRLRPLFEPSRERRTWADLLRTMRLGTRREKRDL